MLVQRTVAQVATCLVRDGTDRDDLIQEVNLRLLGRGATTEGVRDLQAYVTRIVRNVHLNLVAANGRRRREIAFAMDVLPSRDQDLPGVQSDVIQRVLAGLGPRDARVLEEWLGNPVTKGVARSLGLDVRQVKRSLARSAFSALGLVRCPRKS